MKTVQKLEVCFGLAALLSTLFLIGAFLYVYFANTTFGKNTITVNEIIWFVVFSGWLILSSSTVAVGAYYNAVGKRNQSIATICISGFLISIIFVPISFVFFANGAIGYSLLVAAPTICAGVTVILALYSGKKSYLPS